MQNRNINPWTWQDQLGFSQGVETTGETRVLRCAGQTAVNENGMPQHAGDMAAQIRLVMDNIEKVLAAADMSLANVVELNMYTTDMEKFFESFTEVTSRLGKAGIQPASTLLGVARLVDLSLMIEIEVTAVA